MKNNRGFTLIELIVVIAIITILALILIPQITGFISNAQNTTANANAKQCYDVANIKYADKQYEILNDNPEIYNGCVIKNDNNRYRFEDFYGGSREIEEVYWFEDTSEFNVSGGRITNFNNVVSSLDYYGKYTPAN